MTERSSSSRVRARSAYSLGWAVVGTLLLASCGGQRGPPGPGSAIGAVPDLRGARVMVFPVQSVVGFQGLDMTAEVTFALQQRESGVEWIMPDELRAVLARSPGMQVPLDRLAVGAFTRVEVQRIGDPLFGQLRLLGGMMDAPVALIPVQARYRPASAESGAAVELAATLIQTRTGRVFWYGVVEAAGTDPDDRRALAGSAEALARAILPLSRGS